MANTKRNIFLRCNQRIGEKISWGIEKFVDRTLSRSIFHQVVFVSSIILVVLFLLVSFRLILDNSTGTDVSTALIHDISSDPDKSASVIEKSLDWILHFFNPASSFDRSHNLSDKLWVLFVGFTGMFLLGGLLISVSSNIVARRVERIQDGQVSYFFHSASDYVT